VALALSVITYKYVESPVRNSRWLKARRPSVSVALGVALVALSLALASILVSILPKPSPTDELDGFAAAQRVEVPSPSSYRGLV
jgi:hypothetical protein